MEGDDGEKADFAAIGDEDITFAFDTVFIVPKRRISPWTVCGPTWAAASATVWSSARTRRGPFKVHVHTDTPGDALNAAQKYGTLELAKIENMRTQAADLAAGKKLGEHR